MRSTGLQKEYLSELSITSQWWAMNYSVEFFVYFTRSFSISSDMNRGNAFNGVCTLFAVCRGPGTFFETFLLTLLPSMSTASLWEVYLIWNFLSLVSTF